VKEEIANYDQSEFFIFNKNFKTINNNLKLKAPQDEFFNMIKLHYSIFHNIFPKFPHVRKIKETIFNECILKTKSDSKFEEWFSENHGCRHILNYFLIVPLKKNSIWLTEQLRGASEKHKSTRKV